MSSTATSSVAPSGDDPTQQINTIKLRDNLQSANRLQPEGTVTALRSVQRSLLLLPNQGGGSQKHKRRRQQTSAAVAFLKSRLGLIREMSVLETAGGRETHISRGVPIYGLVGYIYV